MAECRFFPWCSYIEDHGCTDDWCEHYQPMPDVYALLKMANEMEEFGNLPVDHPGVRVLHNEDFSREMGYARRIRKALGTEQRDKRIEEERR